MYFLVVSVSACTLFLRVRISRLTISSTLAIAAWDSGTIACLLKVGGQAWAGSVRWCWAGAAETTVGLFVQGGVAEITAD